MSNKKKIEKITNLLKKKDCDYYLLPRTDKFQNEFISEKDERVKWLTGFSGSFAFVIISLNKNFIFTDGRYIDQAKKEINQKNFKVLNISNTNPILWLKNKMKLKEKILLDSWLFTSNNLNYIKKVIKKKKCEVILNKEILIDQIWKPKLRNIDDKIFIRDKKHSGISFERKIKYVKEIFKKKKISSFFFSSPESISWLLNIRGNQIRYTPVVLSFLIMNLNNENFFLTKNNIKLKKYLGSNFKIFSINDLKKILINFSIINKEIFLDPNKTPCFIEKFLLDLGVSVKYFEDPCVNLMLVKNHAEINGSRNCHVRDGVSICRFLYWLSEKIKKKEKITELKASEKLFDFRKNNKFFYDLSFETISGYGANGSIIHYRVTKNTNKVLKKNNLYLFDSGAQYLDGTTDVTRTISIGNKPSLEHKDLFTRVLKGNVELSSSIFSEKTMGRALDKIARKYLKKKKYDYPHGTGHGVGNFLSVHEGPISISKNSKTKFKSGMLLTNEPGFYKSNKYGIRIENILLVKKKNKLLSFEVLTLAPIDIKLIDYKLLNLKDKMWINNYHDNVFNKISKYLDKKETIWLRNKTLPI
ncbi:MAG: Aminopeptidase [Alphaproteobacteria bacterium MarineAlpha6_Bin4]|nr:MAG: Aminopeptidase [Alphaproteobacteria bacterium MarineAlpha6_Bin4]